MRRAHLLAGLVSAAGLFSFASGCALITPVDRDEPITGEGGSGGEAGMGGMGGHGHGGAGGQGGTGGAPECTTEADCPDPGNECVLRTCTNGTCGTSNVAAGLSCNEPGGKVCDGNGACVECAQDADCASGVCQSGACMAASCGDGTLNGNETDLDCGGLCGPCADDKACLAASDCTSKVCTNGACAAATCSDSVQNQGESDVDCGGASCPKCPTGGVCTINADCLGGSCFMGTCVPTCTDLTQNNGETDQDCGGPNCPACADGLMCAGSGDCQSEFCHPSSMLCAGPTCSDGYQNGLETDIDCGGPCPTDCANGGKCSSDGDCTSAFCNPTSGVCAAPSCMDGFQNGGEVGVDCGGPCAALCAGSP